MSPVNRAERWGVAAFLAVLALLFYWKVLLTNRVMIPYDAADFFYPYFSFVHEQLRHLRLPLWDPYVMSGYPIIGDPEAQIFYPVNWLFVVLDPLSPLPYKLVEAQLVLHFLLAGLFMYWLARSFVESKTAALCGAVLFMFSGAMVAHTQHLASIDSMALYPLIFLLARRGLLEKRLFFTVAAGMLFGVLNLAGHWQHSAYLGFLLFLYFAYEASLGPLRSTLWPRWIFSLLLIGGIGAALAMVQVLPTHELGNLSVRSYLTYWDVTAGNEPRFLWTLFLPNYFGGLNGVQKWYSYDLAFNYVFLTVPGCLLALLGMIETIRRRNFFWIGTAALCIELSIGRFGFLAPVVFHTPILNLFRNAATFFDLANFCLCVLAAIGAQSLLSDNLPRPLERFLPSALIFLLLSAVAVGLIIPAVGSIPGWYHMLAMLALAALIIAAMLRNRLSSSVALLSIFALIVFQLFFYNRNQAAFNATESDPRSYVARNVALDRRETLRFLRSDKIQDFRAFGIAEYPWSANGWNVWRIPGITGWNPITLRRYDEYVREFLETSEYTLPYGGPDHNLDSPMFDLLGVKYLVIADPELEKNIHLRPSGKFELAYEDQGWWRTYRNANYLPRAWFYPRAYAVPDEDGVFDAMTSRWFDARRTLILEKMSVPEAQPKSVEELSTISLDLRSAAASSGQPYGDPYCAKPIPFFGSWAEKKDDWLRYDVQGPAEAGRYALLMRYTAAYDPTPSLELELHSGDRSQRSGPVRLAGTPAWDCQKSRTAELGVFELAPGTNRLTITSKVPSEIHIYRLAMMRLPSSEPPESGAFSFDNFSVTPNRAAFRSHLSRDGFVLLNEIDYPGWEARLDGNRVEILRADGVFRALPVSAGDHDVEMIFRPRHFAVGAAISLSTLISFLIFVIWFPRKSS